jgi:hypothetical protein
MNWQPKKQAKEPDSFWGRGIFFCETTGEFIWNTKFKNDTKIHIFSQFLQTYVGT